MKPTDTQSVRAAPITGRGELLRWISWFGFLNGLLFAAVGTRYLLMIGPDSGLGLFYMCLAWLSQAMLLAWLPMVLLAMPLALLWPRQLPVTLLAVLLAATGLSLLVLDGDIFSRYQYHLSLLTVAIFETGTWIFAGVIVLVMLAFQWLLAGNVRQWLVSLRGYGKWVALLMVAVWLSSQGLHMWADASAYVPVTRQTRYLPLFYPMKGKRLLVRLGVIDAAATDNRRVLRDVSDPGEGVLNYPLNPLQCAAPAAPLNILVLLVDALRPDVIDSQLTPAISAFAAQSQQFNQQYSGGNSSRMGIFSMFYGLPSTYWQTFSGLQKPPLLMDELRAQGYQFGLFSAVGFGSPSLIDRTVFAGFPALPDEDGTLNLAARNHQATEAVTAWLVERPADQPFFGFVYYDPGAFDTDEPGAAVTNDEQGTLGEQTAKAYRNGVALMDREIAAVLASLATTGLDKNTLVILLSDHGYEFDELGLGYVGHAGNFAQWQLHSTLLMRWPGREPRQFNYRSAHQDIPATLLQDVLGCTNPASDYSSGHNLFVEKSWDWLLAGSYNSHAIVQPEQIIVTYPGGLVEVFDPEYRPIAIMKLDTVLLQDAMLEMRRFYK